MQNISNRKDLNHNLASHAKSCQVIILMCNELHVDVTVDLPNIELLPNYMTKHFVSTEAGSAETQGAELTDTQPSDSALHGDAAANMETDIR